MKAPFPSLTENYHNASYDAISPTRHELSVANKTIIVTGGGRGLGPEIAKAYAAAGASHLVLLGRTQTTLSRTAEEIKKGFASVSVSTHTADVADEAAIAQAAEKVGKWDVLILNAGLLAEPHSIETSDPADWWRVFEVHTTWLSPFPPPSKTTRFSSYASCGSHPFYSNLDKRQRSNGHNSCLPPFPKQRRLHRRR